MEGKQQIQIKFGTALKKALKLKKLSLREFALEADMEYSHVQRIAAGKVNLELTTIITIAKGLHMTPEELFSFY
jgi:transcriptional regulator with XRE-family HTH domain